MDYVFRLESLALKVGLLIILIALTGLGLLYDILNLSPLCTIMEKSLWHQSTSYIIDHVPSSDLPD